MGTDVKYPTFTYFTPQEFDQYLYLFFWYGMNPSPQIEWKPQSEDLDPIHSSAFLRSVLGPATSLRLRHFKCFLLSKIPRFMYLQRRLTPTSKSMNTSDISRPYFAILGCQAVTYLQTSKKWGSRGSMLTSSALPKRRRLMVSNVTASLTTATPSHYNFVISLRLRSDLTRDTLISIVATWQTYRGCQTGLDGTHP